MPRTKRAVFGLIHHVLHYAVLEEEMIGQNPAAAIKRPTRVSRTEKRVLTPLGSPLLAKGGQRRSP